MLKLPKGHRLREYNMRRYVHKTTEGHCLKDGQGNA